MKKIDVKIVIFDLDGTLTKSKANLDQKTAALFCGLLKKKKAAVIGGGKYGQFKKQFLTPLNNYLKNNCKKSEITLLLKNLFLLPTSGAALYERRNNSWRKIYERNLFPREKEKILAAFQEAFHEIGYRQPEKIFGKIIEDRETQMTFSGLGQKAPLARKKEWNKKFGAIRVKLLAALQKRLSGFEVRLGGLTSIDVTKKGVDKSYGILRLLKRLSLAKKDAVYVGDALYRGGNDFAVIKSGVKTISVKNEKETKKLITSLIHSHIY